MWNVISPLLYLVRVGTCSRFWDKTGFSWSGYSISSSLATPSRSDHRCRCCWQLVSLSRHPRTEDTWHKHSRWGPETREDWWIFKSCQHLCIIAVGYETSSCSVQFFINGVLTIPLLSKTTGWIEVWRVLRRYNQWSPLLLCIITWSCEPAYCVLWFITTLWIFPNLPK